MAEETLKHAYKWKINGKEFRGDVITVAKALTYWVGAPTKLPAWFTRLSPEMRFYDDRIEVYTQRCYWHPAYVSDYIVYYGDTGELEVWKISSFDELLERNR